MEASLVEFSIVVLAQDNNPSILNRDFLLVNEIVPKDWRGDVDEDQLLSTPPFSRVAFRRGCLIEADLARLRFMDLSGGGRVEDSPISEMARKYVNTLPHVRYKAIGTNFKSALVHESPGEFIAERFLARESMQVLPLPVEGAQVKFIYGLERGKLTLSLQPAKLAVKQPETTEPQNVVLAEANFHRDCIDYPAVPEILDAMHHLKEDWQQYAEAISKILGEESEK